ncbi:hypothetical protein RYX36_017648, partial [Vicia faba]
MFGPILMFLFSCESKEIEFSETPSLPVACFEDLEGDEDEEEICSICLVEFEGEDA